MRKFNFSFSSLWKSISDFFNFYGKLIDQDKKGLFKYLYLNTLKSSLISLGVYFLLMFFFIVLSYDFNVEGHLFGMSIGINTEKISYLFYCISIYYIFLTFVNILQNYIKLYSYFNKWNYGENMSNKILSQGFKDVKLFNIQLIRVVSLNWVDRNSYGEEETEYLHLLKYDQQKLREDVINELI